MAMKEEPEVARSMPSTPSTGSSNSVPVVPYMYLQKSSQLKAKPKQDELAGKITALKSDLHYLQKKNKEEFLNEVERRDLQKKEALLKQLEQKLKVRIRKTETMKRVRENFKRKLENLPEESKRIFKKSSGSKGGRPSKVQELSLLHETIMNIALQGSANENRQKSDMIRTVKTLDELTNELQEMGFQLSRSSVYLHLLPRNASTREGKRHISTVPVKLTSPKNSMHSSHPDEMFAKASIHFMEEIAGALGPQEVCFHSQDDIARVPIGLIAASKEAPLILRMEYKVRLTDQDFNVPSKHKLIPSVIAAISIQENVFQSKAVSYSGPTYIGIRSAKQSSSISYQHLADMKRLHDLEEFKSDLYGEDGFVKPIFMLTIDGGPDENPRYEKNINCLIDYFIHFNLDAMFVATNAPGKRLYSNRLERRIAPLSKELAGIVLPHDEFGTHLNDSGKTVNEELEEINFARAGAVLSEIWSQTNIDGFPTIAEYKSEEVSDIIIIKDLMWHKEHVRESQYCLQIVKCQNIVCCDPPRSSYFSLVKDRFFPPPMPMLQTKEGLRCILNDSNAQYPSLFHHIAMGNDPASEKIKRNFPKSLPYDFACPSVNSVLPKRVCKKCGLYLSSLKRVDMHQRHCRIMSADKQHTPSKANEIKICPLRIAARRQHELLCVIRYGLNTEDFEWHEEENVTISYESIINRSKTSDSGTPINPYDNTEDLNWCYEENCDTDESVINESTGNEDTELLLNLMNPECNLGTTDII